MVSLVESKSGKGMGLVPPLMDGTNVRAMANGVRKAPKRGHAVVPASPAEVHVLPANKGKTALEAVSEKVALSQVQDGDPAKLLAEVRDVLFGPTRKLQEARLEELVGILEQFDAEMNSAHAGFNSAIDALNGASHQHSQNMAITNQRIDALAGQQAQDVAAVTAKIESVSGWMAQEMARVEATHKREMDEQADLFTAKLDRQSTEFFRQIGEMAEAHKAAIQDMMANFSAQLQELSAMAKANDDRIVAHVDARSAQIEANMDEAKRLNVKAMTEGLVGLSEKLQAL